MTPSTGYMQPFHFPHPDMMHKNNFISPYDLANLRAVTNSRMLNNSTSSIQSAENLSSSRLSPGSSRPSSSSPRSTQSDPLKVNSSVEVVSTNEQTDEDTEEEQIDVVKSAFVPILRPTSNQPAVNIPDSTVQDRPVDAPRQRSEMKAQSALKINHKTIGFSQETKLKGALNTHKAVWRPY